MHQSIMFILKLTLTIVAPGGFMIYLVRLPHKVRERQFAAMSIE